MHSKPKVEILGETCSLGWGSSVKNPWTKTRGVAEECGGHNWEGRPCKLLTDASPSKGNFTMKNLYLMIRSKFWFIRVDPSLLKLLLKFHCACEGFHNEWLLQWVRYVFTDLSMCLLLFHNTINMCAQAWNSEFIAGGQGLWIHKTCFGSLYFTDCGLVCRCHC